MRGEKGLQIYDRARSRVRCDDVFAVGGKHEGFRWLKFVEFHRISDKTVKEYNWLRSVNDNEVFIPDQVAFAHYYGCQHNVFFGYHSGFYPPSRCPLGDAGYLDEDSVDIP